MTRMQINAITKNFNVTSEPPASTGDGMNRPDQKINEQFGIPEIRYQIATEDLERSYAMLSERIRSATISLAGSSVPKQSQAEEEPER